MSWNLTMRLRGPFDYAQGQDDNFYINHSLGLKVYVDRPESGYSSILTVMTVASSRNPKPFTKERTSARRLSPQVPGCKRCSFRRSWPYSSSSGFVASVMPSLYNTTRPPGSSCISTSEYSPSAN